uniref:Uncharacterized protein n=1 Tax=Arundo donax TaxID=35708 RepID=A0A0A9DP81_ARUDO
MYLLIFHLFRRRQNHHLLLRKRLQARNKQVHCLLSMALFLLLMHHMRSFFHQFLNSLVLESSLSHQHL